MDDNGTWPQALLTCFEILIGTSGNGLQAVLGNGKSSNWLVLRHLESKFLKKIETVSHDVSFPDRS